jgi:hypothetical protein
MWKFNNIGFKKKIDGRHLKKIDLIFPLYLEILLSLAQLSSMMGGTLQIAKGLLLPSKLGQCLTKGKGDPSLCAIAPILKEFV